MSKIKLLAQSYLDELAQHDKNRTASLAALLKKDDVSDDEIVQAFKSAITQHNQTAGSFFQKNSKKDSFNEKCERFLIEADYFKKLENYLSSPSASPASNASPITTTSDTSARSASPITTTSDTSARSTSPITTTSDTSANSVSAIEDVPDEILLHAFQFLNKQELMKLAQVSKKLSVIVRDISLQKNPFAALDYQQKPTIKPIPRKVNHTVYCIEALADGRIITGCENCIQIWDGKMKECLNTIPIEVRQPRHLKALPENKLIIGGNQVIILCDLNAGICLPTFKGLEKGLTDLNVLDNGNVVAVDNANKLHVWDSVTGQEIQSLQLSDGWQERGCCFTVLPENKIACATTAGIHIWNLTTKQVEKLQLTPYDTVNQVVLLKNGLLAGLGIKGFCAVLQIWDLKTNKTIVDKELIDIYHASILELPNGNLAIGSKEGLKIFDFSQQEIVPVYRCELGSWDPTAIDKFKLLPEGNIIVLNGREVFFITFPQQKANLEEKPSVVANQRLTK